MSAEDHERRAAAITPRLAVVTVSDSRRLGDDASGDRAVSIARESGIEVVDRCLVPDEPDEIARRVDDLVARPDVDAIVLLGGTGIGPRDVTPDVVRSRLRLELPGFGEQVRALGWRDVGPSAILSRAIAGVAASADGHEALVFALPGSVKAAESVMREIVAPLLPHAVWERRGRPTAR